MRVRASYVTGVSTVKHLNSRHSHGTMLGMRNVAVIEYSARRTTSSRGRSREGGIAPPLASIRNPFVTPRSGADDPHQERGRG